MVFQGTKGLIHSKWSEAAKIRHRELCDLKRRERSRFLWNYKATHPCQTCGEANPACLVFHHLRQKSGTLGSEARQQGWGIRRLEKEIRKCIVLCANCHAKLHVKAPIL